jgi:hypothetical protein
MLLSGWSLSLGRVSYRIASTLSVGYRMPLPVLLLPASGSHRGSGHACGLALLPP